MRYSGTCPAETPQLIKMKFCTINYVGELTWCTKNGCNRLARGGPTDRWNVTSTTFLTISYFIFFWCLYSPNGLTDLHARSINSDDAVCCKEVPFGRRVDTKLLFCVKIPRNAKFWNRNAKFPAKSIHSNNFWTVRDWRKIPTDWLFTKLGSENRMVTSFPQQNAS